MTKRIVTGENADGGSCIKVDEMELNPLGGGFLFSSVWGSDVPPAFPNDGTLPNFSELFPAAGGYRATLLHILPAQGVAAAAWRDEFDREGPVVNGGLEAAMAGEAPGMHRTDTVDLGIVTSGAIHMELDNGDVQELRTGDVFVQNGTAHNWHNRGETPASMFVVLIGGNPRA